MKYGLLAILGFLIFITCSPKLENTLMSYENYQEIAKIEYMPNGFIKGRFYNYQKGVAIDQEMSYKFVQLNNNNYEYIYAPFVPWNSPTPDTLRFIINFDEPDSSIYIKHDIFVSYINAGEKSYLDKIYYTGRVDTFILSFKDTMVYFDSIESKFQTIYRFDCYTGDDLCETIFVNKEMGVFKRYGASFSDCVEQYYDYGTMYHRKQILMLYNLYLRKDFHSFCASINSHGIERYCGVTRYQTKPLLYEEE